MRFSSRTAWELEENGFAARLRKERAQGHALLDLSVSNPTDCGFGYELAPLLSPLSELSAAHYEPEPLGMLSARSAVADYYRDKGVSLSPDRLCLTTSTSEAYSFLFRLLCDPGDDVLVASPSYPLFDYIARLDGVNLREYPLLYDHGWLIDVHALEQAITPGTRAIIVVHPNNPTGHYCSQAEREALREICLRHGLALIVDEVFLDYALPGAEATSFAAENAACLTFVLSGISKVCGLPQMKCSWIAAAGPSADVDTAMARLEIIADTFLSMNAPVQHALPIWLGGRSGFQQQVLARVQENLAVLDQALRGTQAQRLALDAGWAAIVRVPRTVNEVPFEEAALAAGVIVQPGSFYGLPEGRVILSLLTPLEIWREGVARLAALSH